MAVHGNNIAYYYSGLVVVPVGLLLVTLAPAHPGGLTRAAHGPGGGRAYYSVATLRTRM